MSALLRNNVAWLLYVACALAILPALDMLARYQLRQQLVASAGDTLGALTHADTPHQWSAQFATDLIAGTAFGTTDARFVNDGFRLRSQGEEIQVGVVLSSAIDLGRFSLIQIDLQAETAGSIGLVVGESLEAPVCRSAMTPLARGETVLTISVRNIEWQCQGADAAPPKRAAMLRLRLDLPAPASVTLRSVQARTQTQLNSQSLIDLPLPLLPDPRNTLEFRRALARIAENADQMTWPILQLPIDARVEQSLQARDQIRAAIADAVIVPAGDFQSVTERADTWHAQPRRTSPSRISWLLLVGYIGLLLALRLKPPLDQRLRALLELLAATVVPLGLVIGGFIGDNISPLVLAACVATILFALSLLVGDAPAEPSSRTLKRGWWVALASLALTMALVMELANGRLPQQLPGIAQILRYLAWAAVQQFMICVIVAERIERITASSRIALLGAALVFALLHTPNAMLMLLTFVAGLIWIWNWQRHRALLANIFAHALGGLLLADSLPPEWLHSAEVSARFFL
ncbi:MAG: CPBP family intramembrane metalloprotease [Xanthomonadales bacterium]|nr:CPBP family intramembrane metalloprotease [Xanthomonadales bacterium]